MRNWGLTEDILSGRVLASHTQALTKAQATGAKGLKVFSTQGGNS